MKASVFHKFGDADVLQLEEVATPAPRPGHLLLKVLATGINRLDHYIREGSVIKEISFPHILGSDAAAEVSEIGKGVKGFEVGERVIPVPGYPLKEEDYNIRPAVTAPSFALPGLHIRGAYAQYMEVPARWVVKDRTGLKPEEVATLPVPLATGVRALREVGGVKPGDKVLIQSGASSSGSLQIQVAKALGAEVATTVRDDTKGEYAKSLGADLVINTREEDFVERVKEWSGGLGADVVIDGLGGSVLPKSIDAVKPLGTVVAFGFVTGTETTFNIQSFFFAQKQLKGSMASDLEDLQWGLEQVREGKIRSSLDRTLPLSQAAEAHRLVASNQVKGTIVLLPWAE